MKKYFAAANSSGGFVSWFDEIFAPEDFERIFLIKGGSGTGKSTLMKRIASRACELGCECEYFYCSSDPDSLDGLLIDRAENRPIGLIDATAPHTRDPKLPGAVEEIVNLGEYWDEKLLQASREQILELVRAKSALYTRGYEFLFAAGEISKMLRFEARGFVNMTKMQAAADRLISQRLSALRKDRITHRADDDHRVKIRGVGAISSKGIVQFDSYRDCKFLCAVRDSMSTAELMLDALMDAAKRAQLDIIRAPMPLEPEFSEAIAIPELEMSAVISDREENDDVKLLNMERFIDRGAFDSSDKRRRKQLSRCRSELIDSAFFEFSKVSRLHSRLEAIYISAMDFERLNDLTDRLIERIFR